jgi:hypothetical protein
MLQKRFLPNLRSKVKRTKTKPAIKTVEREAYMSNTEQKVTATKTSVLGGQSLALIWIALGTVGCYLINPLYGWLFLVFSAISVYIIARRFMCNSCYYCKSCTKGIAKLSIIFLGANRVPGLSRSTVVGLAVFLYVALTVVPVFLLAASLQQSFSVETLLVLAGLLAVTVFSVAARIRKGDKLVIS